MKNRSFIKSIIKSIRGQAIVEFALVIPILLLLVFGITDISRLIYHQSLINQTAKEALRMASVGNDLPSISYKIENMTHTLTGNVTTTITASTDDLGNPCTKILLTPSAGYSLTTYISPPYSNSLVTGNSIRVAIEYKMDYITPLMNLFGNTAPLKAVYNTRLEKPPS